VQPASLAAWGSSPALPCPALPCPALPGHQRGLGQRLELGKLARTLGHWARIWQPKERDLNCALEHGLYVSPDMLLFVMQGTEEVLVLFVFHLI